MEHGYKSDISNANHNANYGEDDCAESSHEENTNVRLTASELRAFRAFIAAQEAAAKEAGIEEEWRKHMEEMQERAEYAQWARDKRAASERAAEREAREKKEQEAQESAHAAAEAMYGYNVDRAKRAFKTAARDALFAGLAAAVTTFMASNIIDTMKTK